MMQQFQGYSVSQCNIILDVRGEYSRTLESIMRKLFGAKGQHVLSKSWCSQVHSISPASGHMSRKKRKGTSQ